MANAESAQVVENKLPKYPMHVALTGSLARRPRGPNRSRLIDEAWHQFVLFTKQYVEFCQRYFGQYLDHAPGMSPDVPHLTIEASFADFAEYYQRQYGSPPPDLWQDSNWLTPARRMLVNEGMCPVTLECDAATGMIIVSGPRGPVVSVSELAREALEFIWRAKAFYVRELPGELTDEEKVGLAEVLLARGALFLGV